MFDINPNIINMQFNPGYLNQDIYTIPIEAGISGSLTYFYTKTSKPLWPFANETTTSEIKPTRHPGKVLVPIGAGLGISTYGALKLSNNNLPIFTHVRGMIHTHLLTEIATSFCKSTFQRERPFADTAAAKNETKNNDRLSFFSGHASHAFAYATYLNLLVHEYSPYPAINWAATTVFYSGASVVAGARYVDSQHHLSDVVVGAAAGFTISALVFNRVMHIIKIQENIAVKKPTFYVIPYFDNLSSNNVELGIKLTSNY